MERTINKKHPNIKGWGVDANKENDPTYPMKYRSNEEHAGYSWERPTLQDVNVEVLHSTERPNISAVFGTTVPPKGLSGMIRRFAFRYSENQYRHWLPLILADRVNVFEGILSDIFKGHLPDIAKEKGLKVLWKYRPGTFMQRVATRLLAVTAVFAFAFRKRLNFQKHS
jgi:hypothetical protein